MSDKGSIAAWKSRNCDHPRDLSELLRKALPNKRRCCKYATGSMPAPIKSLTAPWSPWELWGAAFALPSGSVAGFLPPAEDQARRSASIFCSQDLFAIELSQGFGAHFRNSGCSNMAFIFLRRVPMYTRNRFSTRLRSLAAAFKVSDWTISLKLCTAAAMAVSQSPGLSTNEKGHGSRNQSSGLQHKRCFQSQQTPWKRLIRSSTACSSVRDVFLGSKIFAGSACRGNAWEAEDEPPSASWEIGRLAAGIELISNTPSSSAWFRTYLPDSCWRGRDVFWTSLQGCHACDLWEKLTSATPSKILKATKCLL